MAVWLAIMVIVSAFLFVGLGIFYAQYLKGEIQRADVFASVALIFVALVLILASELIAQEISGAIFFLWLPFWMFLRNRRRHDHP